MQENQASSNFVIAGTGTGCGECDGLSQCASCNPSELPALESCSTGTKCLETVYTNCVVYDGPTITCSGATVVTTGTGLTPLIQDLYARMCAGGFIAPTGPTGPPGPAPTITVTPAVQISTPLLPPIVTSTQTGPGAYNFAFRLPAGQDGISPNVVPFNTVTGAPGTMASASLDPSSTSSIKRFNFVIPRGNDGIQGIQGVSITSGIVNSAGHLIITKSDATTFDAGYVVGPAGNAGVDGDQGSPGSNSIIYKMGVDAPGNVAVDALQATSVTRVTASNTSRVGYNGIVNPIVSNANAWLESVVVGDRLQLYNSLDSTIFGIYDVWRIYNNSTNTSHIFEVNLVGGSGTFTMASDISVSFNIKGDRGSAGSNGIDGEKGAVGPNTLVYECNSSTVTAPGKAVLNNGNFALVNALILNETSMLGYTGAVASIGNAAVWLNAIETNARIQITDVDNSDVFAIFRVISSTHVADYHTFNVAVIAASNTLSVTDQNFAINYVNPGLNGNYIVTNYIAPGADPTCPYGGVLIETRSGVDDTLVDPPVKICNPKNGDYVVATPAPTGDGAPCAYGGVLIKTYDGGNNELISTNVVCNGPGDIDITDNCEFIIEKTNTVSGVSFDISRNDSGWYDMLGFAHQSLETNRPQVRRIGKELFFRGIAVIPLANPVDGGTTAIKFGTGAYSGVTGADVASIVQYTGPGGVTPNTYGGIYFNKNASCIPAAVFCNGIVPTLSRTTMGGTIILQRAMLTDGGGATINASTKIVTGSTDYGGALSSVCQLFVLPTGVIYLSTAEDIEQPPNGGVTKEGGSTLRPIICNVRAGDFVTRWNSGTVSFHGAGSSNVNSPLDADTTGLGKWLVTCDGGNENHLGGFSFSIDHLRILLD